MRILSITAQKPNSTGSGVYLTELVKEYAKAGYRQAVVAGIYKDDKVQLPEGTAFYPVCFSSGKLPYKIVGMSDEMPYPSTRYCDMTPEMAGQFKAAFLEAVERAVEDLRPDLILCHHLYLLTAAVREHFPGHKVCGICHNTDLRQMRKTDLERDYIREQICRLDRIFVLQKAQEESVREVYGADSGRITVVGAGYNSEIFFRTKERTADGVTRLVFAGKIAEKKGVVSLIRSLSYLDFGKESLKVYLAGGAGNEKEYGMICRLAAECPYKIQFLGKMPQTELAKVYNRCDIFVLPSFCEGIPLTAIEALACGDRVVMTDLPGVREWMDETVPDADVRYVTLPRMQSTDEPVPECLPDFEKRLAEALADSIRQEETRYADVSGISWGKVAQKCAAQS